MRHPPLKPRRERRRSCKEIMQTIEQLAVDPQVAAAARHSIAE
jgi:hypothetical protein